ncbi:ATP-binding protein [Clostridium botulinum]|uniref:sensor histidine kinase n=1 Tax=Clostridium botulinum TaxID=1491 RepID=UPI003DA325AA
MEKSKSGYYKIRPSARIIKTIGDNLIKDTFAAIVELVKNSYDADAHKVTIEFSNEVKSNNDMGLKINITDDGHGMSFDTVINKWMVPATDDKYHRVVSPNGRILQGRKGIGRYAVALLGEKLKLSTVNELGEETILDIDWGIFENNRYLEDVNIPIKSNITNKPKGTTIEIYGSTEKLFEWSKETIDVLINELSKLISPLNDIFKKEEELNNKKEINDEFSITVIFKDFFVEEYENEVINIEPVELIELYDYRLYGTIDETNKFKLTFVDNVTGVRLEEKIEEFTNIVEAGYSVGNIKIDFRVFDRDPDSIEKLIARGLKNKATGEYFGKNEARNHLNKMSGIGVYRGGFKVRPYGDAAYDWLELDKLRVQSPSRKIGSNQIIGFVEIESEEKSNLVEKSARDGLKENVYYSCFRELLRVAINQLEIRRFKIRKVTGRGRSKTNLGKQINNLFDLDNLAKKIEGILSESDIKKEQIELVRKHLKEEEEKKARELEKIEEIIAIYQGQATLGRVMMILMHEARKPLHWFKNQSKLMRKYIENYIKDNNVLFLNKVEESSKKYESQTEILVNLFKRLDPLAVNRNKKRCNFNLTDVINESIEVYKHQLNESNIEIFISGNKEMEYYGWRSDFMAIFTNLIENSIYWVNKNPKEQKVINIEIHGGNELEYIDFMDNGPGIKKDYIESEVIFEPEFTTKYESNGSGLGLSIAGEASNRNNIKLSAIYSEDGAYFRMSIKEMGEK